MIFRGGGGGGPPVSPLDPHMVFSSNPHFTYATLEIIDFDKYMNSGSVLLLKIDA